MSPIYKLSIFLIVLISLITLFKTSDAYMTIDKTFSLPTDPDEQYLRTSSDGKFVYATTWRNDTETGDLINTFYKINPTLGTTVNVELADAGAAGKIIQLEASAAFNKLFMLTDKGLIMTISNTLLSSPQIFNTGVSTFPLVIGVSARRRQLYSVDYNQYTGGFVLNIYDISGLNKPTQTMNLSSALDSTEWNSWPLDIYVLEKVDPTLYRGDLFILWNQTVPNAEGNYSRCKHNTFVLNVYLETQKLDVATGGLAQTYGRSLAYSEGTGVGVDNGPRLLVAEAADITCSGHNLLTLSQKDVLWGMSSQRTSYQFADYPYVLSSMMAYHPQSATIIVDLYNGGIAQFTRSNLASQGVVDISKYIKSNLNSQNKPIVMGKVFIFGLGESDTLDIVVINVN